MRQLALLILVLVPLSASAQTKDGFVPLFNGKDTDGWEVRETRPGDKDKWSVKDNLLIAKPGGGWIGTKKMYGDFVLKLEWKIAGGGNSGVFLRVPDVKSKESPSYLGMEIQILDDNAPQYKGKLKPYQYCGGLYHFQGPSKEMFKGAGEWNAYQIACKGAVIQVVFNGEKVIDADGSKDAVLGKRPRRGFIGLQNHGTGVEFRNVMIKSLDP
jgi:3-keto-disaccharide hydrolase